MNYKDLIKELLKNRGFETDTEMDAFLHPSLELFHNPFLLSNMKEATERIRKAIQEKQKILIYGDYDCDGISAVSILYLYFRSCGLDPIGFIPSRHTDGYGLSRETVKLIKEKYSPDLVITVDTGISAYEEIKMLHAYGIDTIVTDHHEPPQVIPETIVVDPKIQSDYPFCGLSGAGVAFKLVQALSDLDTALKFVDIASISTVGDIVPLLDENRMMVKLGLKSINGKNPRPSIAFLKSKLKLKELNSTDIAFKIVPRLNACGRISTAEKCFRFLVEGNPEKLEELYQEIEADNNLRLEMSSEIMTRVDKVLESIDLNKEPAVFIRDDEINLGLIGIVASKLVGVLKRPVFVLTKDESGNLKGSVRSIEGINIFNILDKYRSMMVDVGGHSLAGGLTIRPENYKKLKEVVLAELRDIKASFYKDSNKVEYDATITEKDINMALASKIEELEPFGFMNPRPVFKLVSKVNEYNQMKSVKHYKIPVSKSTEIVSFFGNKLSPYFLTDAKKELYVNLEVDNYFSKPRAKAMLKDMVVEDYKFRDEKEYIVSKEIFGLTQNLTTSIKTIKDTKELNIEDFGTLIIVDEEKTAKYYQRRYNFKITLEPLESGESVIVYNPHRIIDSRDAKMYNQIIAVMGENQAKAIGGDIYLIKTPVIIKSNITRDEFKNLYVAVSKMLPISGNNIFEITEKIGKSTKLPPQKIMATISCSTELGFYKMVTSEDGVVELKVSPKADKKNLEDSVVFNALK